MENKAFDLNIDPMIEICEELMKELEDKKKELEELHGTFSALLTKERRNNNELVDARNELIKLWRELPDFSGEMFTIGLKKLGELFEQPFIQTCRERFNEEEADHEFAILCSRWQANLGDPTWQTNNMNGAHGGTHSNALELEQI